MFVEVNIDALVGPSHHFGGVGVGNKASQNSTRKPSHPRRAALEGLRKAQVVAELGVPQYVLPPLRRPLLGYLQRLGFTGEFDEQCAQARHAEPSAYSATFSSAYMWAANAGTVAPACDCYDECTNILLANLSSSWHRWYEHSGRDIQLKRMFAGSDLNPFIHPALPPVGPLRDEGAANHMRLCNVAGDIGLHVFVYGESEDGPRPKVNIARQTLAASRATARLLGLDPARTFFLQQHPDAIDAGVFHNDVIATSHRHLLIMHERAFINAESELQRLGEAFESATGTALKIITVSEEELTLADAVKSYLFNSQLLTPAHDANSMVMLCAGQCQVMPPVRQLIRRWLTANDIPINDVRYVQLDESMSGGGGPACLRLRMPLPAEAIESFAPNYRLTDELLRRLIKLVDDFYPEQLKWESLSSSENLERYERAFLEFERIFPQA